ncbi:MAG: rhodanese-like domain-containing protein [Nitrospira sp.]|nr:rhodanese-like domain-containing protein [Nitrospira sp.]
MTTLLTDQETATSRELQGGSLLLNEPQYIDVRTPQEFETVHLTGAKNIPLHELSSKIEEVKDLSQRTPLVVMCRTQNRAQQAHDILVNHGITNCTILPGGITEWIKQGKPVIRGQKRLSLEGQVRAVAGAFVLAGVGLGYFVHSGFLILPAFVGAGLLHAGLTDSCMMGMLLAKLPYNRSSTT